MPSNFLENYIDEETIDSSCDFSRPYCPMHFPDSDLTAPISNEALAEFSAWLCENRESRGGLTPLPNLVRFETTNAETETYPDQLIPLQIRNRAGRGYRNANFRGRRARNNRNWRGRFDRPNNLYSVPGGMRQLFNPAPTPPVLYVFRGPAHLLNDPRLFERC
ncbi:hypothetical protein niasHT_027083 [Heterodera trifolii]|uniref:Uncharacterized protein n=1 Tax=Heterodera trifolii TaxID=157864 RepID=A0ABD2JGJ6_9BILA